MRRQAAQPACVGRDDYQHARAIPRRVGRAFVAAGLDGIRNKIDPGEPNIGENMYDVGLKEISRRGIGILPQSLYEALEELKLDSVIQQALGPIYGEFLSLKEGEWKQYHRDVTQWEVDRYLTMF